MSNTKDGELYYIVREGTSSRSRDIFGDPPVVEKCVLYDELKRSNGPTSRCTSVGITIKDFKEKFGDYVNM